MQSGKKKSATVKKNNVSPSEQSLLSEEQEEYVVTEYIMEYTDIFEPSPSQQKMDFIDVQEGDAICEVSDEDIVAHTGELKLYEDIMSDETQHKEESGDEAIAEVSGTIEEHEDIVIDNGTTEEHEEHIPEGFKEVEIVEEEEFEIKEDVLNEGEILNNDHEDIESQDEISLSQTEDVKETCLNDEESEERDSNDEELEDEGVRLIENDDDSETTEVDKLINNKNNDTIKKEKPRHHKVNTAATQFEEQPLLTSSDSTSPEPPSLTPPMRVKSASPPQRTKTGSPSSRAKNISHSLKTSSPSLKTSSRTSRTSPPSLKTSSPSLETSSHSPKTSSPSTKTSPPSSKTSLPTTQSRKPFSSKAYPGKVVKSVSSKDDQDVSNSVNRTKGHTEIAENNTVRGKNVRVNDNAKSNKTSAPRHHSRENGEGRGTKHGRVNERTEHSSDANFFRARLPQTSKRPPKRHVWLCRDSEIHRLIAEKAAILRRYKEEGVTGRNRLKEKGFPNYSEVDVMGLPSVGFAGKIKDDSHQSSLPYSKHPSSQASQGYRLQGQSSSEDEDEKTNRVGVKGGKPSGTFAVGLAARRDNNHRNKQQQDHEKDQHLSDDGADGCELCAAEAREKEKHEKKLKELETAAKAGPHHPRNLMLGIVYAAKFLGSTKLMSPSAPNKSVRLEQAQEAIARIKVPEGEEQPSSDVDLFISTERIKVVSAEHKQTLMDHHLKTISFIADIGNIIVVMARLSIDDDNKTWSGKMPDFKSPNTEKNAKVVCHVLETNEAQTIAKTVGQAFSIAYHEFLKVNQLNLDEIEDAEYNGILEQQKILGEELSLLADVTKTKEVVIHKKYGECLLMMIVESGWGSMIPTVLIAHLDNKGPIAKSGQLNVGNQILAVNGQSLVGLPLLECQSIIKGMKYEERVALKVVCCPPTVEISVNRPDTKYQLGFSVQNGMICSLMRGGIAERGGVRVGHKIIELNGESVVTSTHHYIVDILQTKIGELRMKTMPITLYKLLVGLEAPQYL